MLYYDNHKLGLVSLSVSSSLSPPDSPSLTLSSSHHSTPPPSLHGSHGPRHCARPRGAGRTTSSMS